MEARGLAARCFMPGYIDNYKTIVVATDFSDVSCGALHYAKQLARRVSAKLLLVHVIDSRRFPLSATAESSGLSEAIDAAEDELERVAAGLSNDFIRNTIIVRHGSIRETLLQLISERNADLLVIGTTGKGCKSGERLGSAAEMLLRTMPCPVLTVGKRVRQDALEATHLRQVLFPTDFSEASRATATYAEHLTRFLTGHLLLLHVDEAVTEPLLTGSQGGRAGFKAIMREMQEPSIVADSIMHRGRVAESIVTVAAEKQVDIIVLGIHGGADATLVRGREGGIAYDVVRLAKCPVFTLCPFAQREALKSKLQAATWD
jgi:nucleotide-binding universal stress UspA family protein